MKQSIKYVSLFVMVFFVVGCGSVSNSKKDPLVEVEKRIHALMTAKVNGEWEKVYDFYDSNFKKSITKKVFAGPNKADFTAYQIEYIKLNPSGKSLDALVKSDMTSGTFDLKGVSEKQHWIMEDGQWVLVVKPVKGFID